MSASLNPMKRDIVIGFVVLIILLGGVYLLRRSPEKPGTEAIDETPVEEVEKQLEEKFNFDVPEDVEKASLKDLTGEGSSGLGTRDVTEDGVEVSIIADLPSPDGGEQYQGWMSRGAEGEENFDRVSLGVLREAKGGWMLEIKLEGEYGDYNRLQVSRETRVDDTPEKLILDGEF